MAVECVPGAIVARVVFGSAWRAKSCMSRSDTPASSPMVIAECRSPCGVRCTGIAASRASPATRYCTLEAVIRRPAWLTSSGPRSRPSMARARCLHGGWRERDDGGPVAFGGGQLQAVVPGVVAEVLDVADDQLAAPQAVEPQQHRGRPPRTAASLGGGEPVGELVAGQARSGRLHRPCRTPDQLHRLRTTSFSRPHQR